MLRRIALLGFFLAEDLKGSAPKWRRRDIVFRAKRRILLETLPAHSPGLRELIAQLLRGLSANHLYHKIAGHLDAPIGAQSPTRQSLSRMQFSSTKNFACGPPDVVAGIAHI